METIRVGLVEVGHWHSGMYVSTLMGMDDVEIVAISDRNVGVARCVGSKIGCPFYADYLDLLRNEELDFVFAFGVHLEMPRIIEALIDRGMPFIIEKPAGTDYRQLEPLVRRAEEEDLFSATSFPYRCSPWVRKIDEIRRSGLLGNFLHGYYRYITGSPMRYVDWGCPWMLNKELSGGGCTINLSIHFIDLARYLTGSEVSRVFARMGNSGFNLEIEDLSIIVLELMDGSLHTIETGYCNPSGWNSAFSITTRNYAFLVCGERFRMLGREEEELSLRNVNIYRDMIEETVERFRAGMKPVASLNDCLIALKVVNRAYESKTQGRPIGI